MASVTLANGLTLSNLIINGDNFISYYEITNDMFYNMSPVVISVDGKSTVHDHMELTQITKHGDEWWFVIRDLTNSELEQAKLRGDVDFIAMMSDIDLDEI